MIRQVLVAGWVGFVGGGALAAEPTVSEFAGRWIVTDIVGYADTSGGIPEAKRLLGKPLVISANGVEFDAQKCVDAKGLKAAEVETAPAFEKYYGVPVVDVGLPAKTVLLDSVKCVPVFRVDAQRIAAGWNGVVFRATRDK
jgi:hypothetical protein